MFHFLAAATLVLLGSVASAAQKPGTDAVNRVLSLAEAKEEYEKALDLSWDELQSAIATRQAAIDASLKAGRDPAGKTREALEVERALLLGERVALESQGRWPTTLDVSPKAAARVSAAKEKLLGAYEAASRAALMASDMKRDERLAKSRAAWAGLNMLGSRWDEATLRERSGAGTNAADWRFENGVFTPPSSAAADGTWTPFGLRGEFPAQFLAKFTFKRASGDGDLIVRVEDALGFQRPIAISKAQIDAIVGKDAAAERDCRLRVLVANGMTTLEIDGESVESFASVDTGLGLDLSHIVSIALLKSDKRGPLRVSAASVRLLPGAQSTPTNADDPTVASGSADEVPAGDPGDACGGSISVTSAWRDQLSIVRDARKKCLATTDRIATDLLRRFEDEKAGYLQGLLIRTTEELRKANLRIETERQRYLYGAVVPSLIPALLRTPLENEYATARKQFMRAFDQTEEVLRLQSRPEDIRLLREDRAEAESYQDIAPWFDPEALKAMVKAGRELHEWRWVGIKWLAPTRPAPDGAMLPFVLEGELPVEFQMEWTIECPKLASEDRFELRFGRSGDDREAVVLGAQILALATRNPAGDLAPITLRALVLRERTSIALDDVRLFCQTSADAGLDAGVVAQPTEFSLARVGSLTPVSVLGFALKPVKSSAKRASRSGGPTKPTAPAPRIAPPEREKPPPLPRSAPADEAGPAPTLPVKPAPPSDRSMTWAEVLEAEPDSTFVVNANWRASMELEKLPWRVRDRASGIEMLLVPPGSYSRGAAGDDLEASPEERPAHRVTITKPFYIGRYEVQATEFLHVTKGAALDPENLGVPWVGTYTATEAFFERAPGLRLPTEAEWEYACRAGGSDARYADLAACAWVWNNADGRAHEVGQLAANALGLHDMLGNVWEWCSDYFDAGIYKACVRGVVDPTGPAAGTMRVLRGGSFLPKETDSMCRVSSRIGADPGGTPASARGFRVVRHP